MIERCHSCHNTLKPEETVCYTCASPRRIRDPKPSPMQRCAGVIKVLFVISCLLTVASLFLPATPKFVTCFATTVVLMFVNRSAQAMSEKPRS
jgi:hypothetical protein